MKSDAVFTTFIVILWGVVAASAMTVGFSFPAFVLATLLSILFIATRLAAGLSALILLTMLFERWFTLTPIVWRDVEYKFYPLDVLLVIIIGVLAFVLLAERDRPRLVAGDRLLLLFFFLVFIFGVVGYMRGVGETLLIGSALKNYIFYGLLFFVASTIARNPRIWRGTIHAMMIGGILLLPFVVIGIVRGEGLWTMLTPLSTEGRRLLGFPHATALTIPFILLLMHMLFAGQVSLKSVGVLALSGIGILGSLMRHLWLALGVILVIAWTVLPSFARATLARVGRRFVLLGAVFFFLLAAFMIIFPWSSVARRVPDVTRPFVLRIQSLIHGTDDLSTSWRVDVWRASLASVAAHPFTGIGFGQPITFQSRDFIATIPVREIHNSPLVILVQMGIIGFVVFVAAMVLLLKEWWWRLRRASAEDTPAVLGVGLAGILFLIGSLFQPYFEMNTHSVLFWILLGLMRAAPAQAENSKSQITNSKQTTNTNTQTVGL
ncbi:O-antigen ligase family protein [Candidatus Uhrbacteria bacterium]|nr:O-antigen ligase family protein [Candidatus Uhrbacteria bacterium]